MVIGARKVRYTVLAFAALLPLTVVVAFAAYAIGYWLPFMVMAFSVLGALVATRRRRSQDETEVWAAHHAVIDAEVVGKPEFETDRARFIGRGRDNGISPGRCRGCRIRQARQEHNRKACEFPGTR